MKTTWRQCWKSRIVKHELRLHETQLVPFAQGSARGVLIPYLLPRFTVPQNAAKTTLKQSGRANKKAGKP